MPYKDAEKEKQRQKEYRSRPEVKARLAKYMRENHRKYNKYGYVCTDETYNALFASQQGCCAICGVHQTALKRNLAVDHCHTNGDVRGLLCVSCNTHLGIYEKYKEVFENYISKRK